VEFKNAATEDGQRFVYSDMGEGPLVVLFHGFPDLPTGWEDTAKALNAAGYRTVVPYLRGYHPDTIVPGRDYSGDMIGGDALRLLDAIGERRAVLVGHDWGAAVVYRASLLGGPERVRGMCAVAIPHPRVIKPSLGLLWKARHFVTLKLPTGKMLASSRDFKHIDTLMRRWAPEWKGPDREKCLADIKRAFSDPVVLDGALDYYRDAERGGVPNVKVPGLVIGGTTDLLAPSVYERSPEAFDAPCEVVIAPGAGHWPHREAAELFHERLIGWLGRLPSG
jgi:pimeloyl-ACP methyl ester carboxylesterase